MHSLSPTLPLSSLIAMAITFLRSVEVEKAIAEVVDFEWAEPFVAKAEEVAEWIDSSYPGNEDVGDVAYWEVQVDNEMSYLEDGLRALAASVEIREVMEEDMARGAWA